MTMNIDTASITNSFARLGAIGNNISNENTVGYKSASFDAVLGQATKGNGVNFSQGVINVDNKPLNIAINGTGFLKFQPTDPLTHKPTQNAPPVYTRDGQLMLTTFPESVDKSYLTNLKGDFLMGGDGKPFEISSTHSASASAKATMRLNLDASESAITTTFDPSDSTTYNKTSISTIYDASGLTSTLTNYYVKSGTDTWDIYSNNSATPSTTTKDATLTFNAKGQLLSATAASSATTATKTGANVSLTLSGAPGVTFLMGNPTQLPSYFNASAQVDGGAEGLLSTVSIGSDGTIIPVYDSKGTGRPEPLKTQINLFTFKHNEGLKTVGVNGWIETNESGKPESGLPTNSGFGSLQGGATEGSNVDATKAMIDLLSAQRAFQAESQVVNTQSQILQEVSQLGR
jgi:flagellar hook protein FlgE